MTAPRVPLPLRPPSAERPERVGPDGWSSEIVADPAAFTALADDWDRLHRACAAATPFQARPWPASWWRRYGTDGRLRLALVRRRGRLVGLAPMMLARRGPWWVLSAVGTGISDFGDVLVDDAHRAETLPRLARALLRVPGWQILDLREVRPGAAAEGLPGVWPGARHRLEDSLCMHLPGQPIEQVIGGLKRRTASRVRAKMRHIDRLGVHAEEIPAADAGHAVGQVLRMHRLQWANRGITAEHLRDRFAEHLRATAREMTASGDARVYLYRCGGELVAGDFVLLGHGMVGPYLYGVHPAFRSKVDVSVLLLRQNLRLAHETGRPVLSLLRGEEPYKTRWRPQQQRSARLVLGRTGRAAAAECGAYVALLRGRRAAADLVKDRMPALLEQRRRLERARTWATGRGWGL